MLAVDATAFPPFWRLDGPGLQATLAATPSARLRVTIGRDGRPAAQRLRRRGSGRTRGYLQRLAVAPAAQGGGVGAALVVDGLRWLRRWGTKEVFVNTQEGNDSAIRLYERLGFRLQTEGLAVLRRALGEAS